MEWRTSSKDVVPREGVDRTRSASPSSKSPSKEILRRCRSPNPSLPSPPPRTISQEDNVPSIEPLAPQSRTFSQSSPVSMPAVVLRTEVEFPATPLPMWKHSPLRNIAGRDAYRLEAYMAPQWQDIIYEYMSNSSPPEIGK